MSRSVNKIILVGNVGRDPEVHVLGTGEKVAHFSLATTRTETEEGYEGTDWHRLTARGSLAQFCEDYVKVGDRIYVEGKVEYDSYERHGVTIPSCEVVMRELVLLSANRRTTTTNQEK